MDYRGFVILPRSITSNEWWRVINAQVLFIYLLTRASYTERHWRNVLLKAGQVPFGRTSAAKDTGLTISQIRTAEKRLELDSVIATLKSNQGTIITIIGWDALQNTSHDLDSEVATINNKTINNKQIYIPKNIKKEKPSKIENNINASNQNNALDQKEIEIQVKKTKRSKPNKNQSQTIILEGQIIDYLNNATGSNFKPTAKLTASAIRARLSEGYLLKDFQKVIETKKAEWANDEKMSRFLRPTTLFGTKFDEYLNQFDPEADKAKREKVFFEGLQDLCKVKI